MDFQKGSHKELFVSMKPLSASNEIEDLDSINIQNPVKSAETFLTAVLL